MKERSTQGLRWQHYSQNRLLARADCHLMQLLAVVHDAVVLASDSSARNGVRPAKQSRKVLGMASSKSREILGAALVF